MKKLTGILAALTLCSTLAQAAPTLELQTSLGRIVVELDAQKAPKSSANFLQYAKDGFYNGTVFHRVIPGFMIQGGGFDAGMSQKATRAPIENEAKNGLRNRRGTLSMARTMDPHSATAQFFINHADNAPLDYPGSDGWGYAVIGKVTEGMDVVDKIRAVRTGNKGFHQDVPVEDVIIEKAEVV
ncbi:Peptidyl-prolyl cis-trans isomerase cyp18 [bioreactor metagenome]|uniref:peptidylprolyl isomerase n=1 Tax=bioreactor metagenome TaxID=1076179 RepID=A0A645HDF8_9ZZZZ